MPLVPLTGLLDDARSDGYAVGYFEAWDSYSIEAVLQAAEAEAAPVILGFGCLLLDQGWLDAGGIEILGALGHTVAKRARVPVALLLNEAHSLGHALRGIDAGFNAVMLCTDDAEVNAQLVEEAHERGVFVEGELGTLPDGDASGGVDSSGASLTDPAEAAAFVARTGVDALAVSIGNVHTLEGGVAAVELDRLAAIHANVDVPLVIHGGTSFPAGLVPEVIRRGVAKFNVGTALKRAFLEGLVPAAAAIPRGASPHDLVGSHAPTDLHVASNAQVIEVVRGLMRLYGASGRARASNAAG
jgi:ketose-bisphosphate aldolase